MDNKPTTLQDMQRILSRAALAITAPIHNVTKDTTPEYFRHLQDVPLSLLEASVDYVIENDSAFFPSVYSIRDAARKLICMTLDIPSPAEAWAQVKASRQHVSASYCEAGATMRDGLKELRGGEYLGKIREWGNHVDTCGTCHEAYNQDVYDHPSVAMTVRQLGGRDALFTGNPSADRARFLEAFREIVDREVRMATNSNPVKKFIHDSKESLMIIDSIQSLTKRLGAGQ